MLRLAGKIRSPNQHFSLRLQKLLQVSGALNLSKIPSLSTNPRLITFLHRKYNLQTISDVDIETINAAVDINSIGNSSGCAR